ncbi:hypothetical protein EDD85DRAFT_103957 [Armillaria nabsnona]|nr:hypothetical protein EDD85DRAFT_103957 [Armillaria nabsnona]
MKSLSDAKAGEELDGNFEEHHRIMPSHWTLGRDTVLVSNDVLVNDYWYLYYFVQHSSRCRYYLPVSIGTAFNPTTLHFPSRSAPTVSISYLFSNASHLGPPKECSRRQLGLTPRSSYLGRPQAGARTYTWAVRSPMALVTEAKRGDEFRLLRVNGIRVLADTTRNCHLRRPRPFVSYLRRGDFPATCAPRPFLLLPDFMPTLTFLMPRTRVRGRTRPMLVINAEFDFPDVPYSTEIPRCLLSVSDQCIGESFQHVLR